MSATAESEEDVRTASWLQLAKEPEPSDATIAGYRPPTDREALLATYLEWQTTPDPAPRLCACGCGQPIIECASRGRPRKYSDETHRKRSRRRQG